MNSRVRSIHLSLLLVATTVCALAADSAPEDVSRSFEPLHYRPLPVHIAGLKTNSISLDGDWRINPAPRQDIRRTPLNGPGWAGFKVPGQWLQQGFDVPQDQTVAMAREFTVPKKWSGHRVFLRFDAIHAGTTYWLNSHELGHAENLFTPVEWDITDAVEFGGVNRLDLEMKVATASERLSCMSSYAGYNLGGIDRAVKIYALPSLYVSSLRLNAGLDKAYRDGELSIDLGLENTDHRTQNGLAVSIQIFDAGGRPVRHLNSQVGLDPLKPGANNVSIASRVANPLKWNAEQPNLYKLVLTLKKDGKALEQIERQIGFRTVEAKNRQLYVNGVPVKLAGVCHHEIDPLTGRADTGRHAEEDVKLFKSANLNYVRTSHYPCTQEFLDAADRYGLYVESEAPFCWVAPATNLADLKAVLTATSAMIDYNHAHPSVIVWSLANESHWSELFNYSAKLCKQLDPTRPTTLEHIFSNEGKATCDIISRHYQNMPYDELLKDDPRPFLHGECFFLVYHERTNVAIDPGLRELWAFGSAEPGSDWTQSVVEHLKAGGYLLPGIYPGAWSYIYRSAHCIGSEIWAGVDDIAFLPGGKVVSSENGNAFWGIIDGWRRPKPELELAKFVFSPVWFPVRQIDYAPGQASVRVPVENRYSFTDLNQFDFIWEVKGAMGKARINVPPASKGEIEIPIPKGTAEGSVLLVRAVNGGREIVNATLSLGKPEPSLLPQAHAGAPAWSDNGRLITIEGRGFSLILDKATGDFDAANPMHKAPMVTFPSLHVTRHDFGDLDRKKPPFAEFPNAKTRVVDNVTVADIGSGLEMTVKDHFEHFAGAVRWLIDKDGVGKVSYDYTYTGKNFYSREIGIKALLHADCDEVKWRRWSEWGNFPKDSISRTEGTAKAHRDKQWPDQPANVKPAWPWSQDQTELGTADFRSIKFCIYEASLEAPDRSGVRVDANADAHFRACLAGQNVQMHILSQCPLAPVLLKKGDRLTGNFSVSLLAGRR